jgi:hypothetical protein
MVDVEMNPMSSKVIRREACLRAKGPLGYERILDQKGVQTFEGKKSQKK